MLVRCFPSFFPVSPLFYLVTIFSDPAEVAGLALLGPGPPGGTVASLDGVAMNYSTGAAVGNLSETPPGMLADGYSSRPVPQTPPS